MKKIFLFHLLLVCPVIFLIWYIVFPNYLGYWKEILFSLSRLILPVYNFPFLLIGRNM